MKKVYVIYRHDEYARNNWSYVDDGKSHDTEQLAEARVAELIERYPPDMLGGAGPRFRIQPEYRP